MVIFKCAGYFCFHIPEGICFAGFLPFLARGYTLHISICVFLFCFSSLMLLFLVCVCLLAFSLLFISAKSGSVQKKAKTKQIPSGI
jgi:hypothetical protein